MQALSTEAVAVAVKLQLTDYPNDPDLISVQELFILFLRNYKK